MLAITDLQTKKKHDNRETALELSVVDGGVCVCVGGRGWSRLKTTVNSRYLDFAYLE